MRDWGGPGHSRYSPFRSPESCSPQLRLGTNTHYICAGVMTCAMVWLGSYERNLIANSCSSGVLVTSLNQKLSFVPSLPSN